MLSDAPLFLARKGAVTFFCLCRHFSQHLVAVIPCRLSFLASEVVFADIIFFKMLVIPCRRGGIPNLTPKMAREILDREEERILSITIFSATEHLTAIDACTCSFAELCDCADFTSILTVRSPHIGGHTSAPSNDSGVACDMETGRVHVSVSRWANEIVPSVRPTHAVAMYDASAPDEPPSKKRRTAASRTLQWSRAAAALQRASAIRGADGANGILFPATVAAEVFASLAEAADSPSTPLVAGVVVDTMHQNESVGDKVKMVADCKSTQPQSEGRTVLLATVNSISSLLLLACAGATHLECALPWSWAEKGQAIRFDATSGMAMIDLNDPAYRVHTSPLSTSCRCYTCSRHTMAYLHHLLTVQEMNSTTLLCCHNLTQLVDALRAVRDAPAKGDATVRMLLFGTAAGDVR